MKAIVCTRYGPPDVLQLREIEKPAPKSHDLLKQLVEAGTLKPVIDTSYPLEQMAERTRMSTKATRKEMW
jgi:NADPH:quinone reductase-like Zn-dependent oxidoreductase